LRDKTSEQYRASLERIFFHDLKNVVSSLNLSTECFLRGEDETKRAVFGQKIKEAAEELVHEVEVQSSLLENAEDRNGHHLFYDACKVSAIVSEIERYCDSHPAATGKELQVAFEIDQETLVKTDRTLLKRVLANMIINGFEASQTGEVVRLEVAYSSAENALAFRVHNAEVIPASVQLRIFQRNFTTKDGTGRGLGTYSMKLIGEQYLGGHVSFSSDVDHGTVFTFSIPLHQVIATGDADSEGTQG
jgi:signal transduction histidine kinase